jgi:hypothetical protein
MLRFEGRRSYFDELEFTDNVERHKGAVWIRSRNVSL